MALKTLVKVSNITNLSDARYCAGMGVDFLGFRVIEGQSGRLDPKSFQEIRGWITGPQIVAEVYGIQDVSQITGILENYLPDYFELSLEDYIRVGSSITLPYILNIGAGQALPAFLVSSPAYILTDISPSSSKFIPDHDVLAKVSTMEELNNIIQHTGISGICLTGGSEIRPGLKNYDELSGILEALEEE
jgi:phosphoribosylanthranilate isomerase